MNPKRVFIVFPHHLFRDLSLLRGYDEVCLIEEHLFFSQYAFHKQKLVLHRSSMKRYERLLQESGICTQYVEAAGGQHDIRRFVGDCPATELACYDPCDDWLMRRLQAACMAKHIALHVHGSPMFLTGKEALDAYFGGRQRYFQADFYMQQRKRLKVLVDEQLKPEGGKWSFDADNRLKYPSGQRPPRVTFPAADELHREAVTYVERHFAHHYGSCSETFVYPADHTQADDWLRLFLEERFRVFGDYEDAIVGQESILHHSVLTPMLNIGLLTPAQVLADVLQYGLLHQVPLNSLEGFVRQLIGWREFIRGVYLYCGRRERVCNFWKFTRRIPPSFYNGTTGILPVDETIRKVVQTGYCHHIERLMVLGNFMLLCEFDPDEVYRWFMELFADAYDWVMVPNVYSMSQFADGGLMATKPYISGSSYILKMSHYPKGNWCAVWDALFWRFMDRQRGFFSGNPRLGMLLKTYDKMSAEKKAAMAAEASVFLATLDSAQS